MTESDISPITRCHESVEAALRELDASRREGNMKRIAEAKRDVETARTEYEHAIKFAHPHDRPAVQDPATMRGITSTAAVFREPGQ